MQVLQILPILSTMFSNIQSEMLKFDGYQVYRTKMDQDSKEKIKFLENHENYSIWSSLSDEQVDVMVPPELKGDFLKMFPNTELFIDDVQTLIDGERPQIRPRSTLRAMGWEDYYTYNEICNWLKELVDEYPNIVTLVNVGKSYEGRDILGVHVSYSQTNKNKSIVLEGGIHAREWIGVSTVTYQLNELLKSKDPVVRNIAESHDWYIFPIFNPDGYSYTFTNSRMWRKTRKPYGLCYGSDPNRNWAYKWHEGNFNYFNPCSDTYPGPSAFSEPETKALSEYFKTIGPHLIGYISHHAYSQVLLLPYGDSKAHRDNYDELYSVGTKMAEEIKAFNGTEYKVGNIVDIMYKATGNNVDWIKNSFKTRMTFIYELRDHGQYGFLLPANQIIPTGQETLIGLITMLNEFQKIDDVHSPDF